MVVEQSTGDVGLIILKERKDACASISLNGLGIRINCMMDHAEELKGSSLYGGSLGHS